MKGFKKPLLGAVVALAMTGAAQANIISVDGIYWDPAAPNDFSATSGFYQWFQGGIAPDATTAVDISGALGPGSPVGSYLTGVGTFNTLNTANNIPGIPTPETNPAQFAPNTQLTYSFGGIKILAGAFAPTPLNPFNIAYTLDLTDAFFDVWVDPAKDYDDALAAGTNLNKAIGGSLFLHGVFESLTLDSSFLTFGDPLVLAGSTKGLISVISGDAFGNFDTNSKTDLFGNVGDITFTGSAQFNIPVGGSAKYTPVGTGEFQGNTVPEPESLALVGLALAGIGGLTKRRAKKS